MRIFEVTLNLRSISSFRLPACFLMSAHMKQRLISTFMVCNPPYEKYSPLISRYA